MAGSKMKLLDRVNALPETAAPAAPAHVEAEAPRRTRSTQGYTGAAARQGKKATVGHFSEPMSRKLNAVAAMQGRTLQSCMGEAWDDFLVKYGEQPFEER